MNTSKERVRIIDRTRIENWLKNNLFILLAVNCALWSPSRWCRRIYRVKRAGNVCAGSSLYKRVEKRGKRFFCRFEKSFSVPASSHGVYNMRGTQRATGKPPDCLGLISDSYESRASVCVRVRHYVAGATTSGRGEKGLELVFIYFFNPCRLEFIFVFSAQSSPDRTPSLECTQTVVAGISVVFRRLHGRTPWRVRTGFSVALNVRIHLAASKSMSTINVFESEVPTDFVGTWRKRGRKRRVAVMAEIVISYLTVPGWVRGAMGVFAGQLFG